MKKMTCTLSLASSVLITALVLPGCVQMPTEKQSISDQRPQISFKLAHERMLSARVYLDGLDAGPVSDYLEGTASMRIRPGSHMVRVTLGSEVLLEEKFYSGDGVNRTFIVK